MVFNIHPIRLYGIHLPPTLSIWLNRRDPRAVLDGDVHDTIGQTASIVEFLYAFRPGVILGSYTTTNNNTG